MQRHFMGDHERESGLQAFLLGQYISFFQFFCLLFTKYVVVRSINSVLKLISLTY